MFDVGSQAVALDAFEFLAVVLENREERMARRLARPMLLNRFALNCSPCRAAAKERHSRWLHVRNPMIIPKIALAG